MENNELGCAKVKAIVHIANAVKRTSFCVALRLSQLESAQINIAHPKGTIDKPTRFGYSGPKVKKAQGNARKATEETAVHNCTLWLLGKSTLTKYEQDIGQTSDRKTNKVALADIGTEMLSMLRTRAANICQADG